MMAFIDNNDNHDDNVKDNNDSVQDNNNNRDGNVKDNNKNNLRNLKEEDKIFPAGPLGNYSLAGFEMVTC